MPRASRSSLRREKVPEETPYLSISPAVSVRSLPGGEMTFPLSTTLPVFAVEFSRARLSPRHLTRAVLESVAFALRHVAGELLDAGARIDEVRVCGGQSLSWEWNQIKADALHRPVLQPRVLETTALGASSIGIAGMLGLPMESTVAFIVGFFRRDYGAAGLFDLFSNGLLVVMMTGEALKC